MKTVRFFFPILLACAIAACKDAPGDADADTAENAEESVVQGDAEAEEEPCRVKNDFLPEDWKILKEAKGDLNKDGRPDIALVLQNTDPKNLIKDDFAEIDGNPRLLLILFAGEKKDCYFLHTESKTFVLAHTEMNMDDPFSEIAIVKGTLRLQFLQFATAGSWETAQYDYIWRYQDEAFKLIGANVSGFHRASGEARDVSVNFSTGKYSIKTYNMFDESVKEEEVWKELKSKSLQTFKTFPLPWSWKVNDDLYL